MIVDLEKGVGDVRGADMVGGDVAAAAVDGEGVVTHFLL